MKWADICNLIFNKFRSLTNSSITFIFRISLFSSDSDMDICFDDAPALTEGESVTDYFDRTREYWMTKAQEFSDEEGLGVKGKTLVKLARDLCKSACSNS